MIGLFFVALLMTNNPGHPVFDDTECDGASPKEKALRRDVERALGKNPKGYFLVAKREITSAPGDPINFTATLHVYDGRDEATDALVEYLIDDTGGKRGFRLIERFNPNSMGKEVASLFRAQFETALKRIRLPQTVEITTGVAQIGSSEFEQVTVGPTEVKITIARQPPKSKKQFQLLLVLP